MALFQNPFFKSQNKKTESDYESGVKCLAAGDYIKANQLLKKAAVEGHISALYNLVIMNGSGMIEPFNIDFAAACLYKAAQGGHPKAQEVLYMLEAADRGGMGTTHLSNLALNSSPPEDGTLPFLTMITGCRFFAAVCKATGATQQVINYELDAASLSDHGYVQRFVKRCGVPANVFSGGLNRLQEGDAADQITDGLNQLFLSMRQAGYTESRCVMARCTIVSYVIAHSEYASFSPPLPSVSGFFNALYDAPVLIFRKS